MPDTVPKPPRAPGPQRPTGKTTPPRATPSNKVIVDGLTQLTRLGATGLAMTGDPISADVWTQVGPRWAEAMGDLAKTNAALRRALTALVEGGQWGAVIASSLCMLAPVIGTRASGLPDHVRASLTFLPQALGQADLSGYMAAMQAQAAEETPPPATAPGAR